MNRKKLAMVMGYLAIIFFFGAASLAAEAEPKVGQTVAGVKFSQPASEAHAKYLGLGKQAAFTLKDIKAPYVLVEQMNTT